MPEPDMMARGAMPDSWRPRCRSSPIRQSFFMLAQVPAFPSCLFVVSWPADALDLD